jgi:hypothetical protein
MSPDEVGDAFREVTSIVSSRKLTADCSSYIYDKVYNRFPLAYVSKFLQKCQGLLTGPKHVYAIRKAYFIVLRLPSAL